MLPERLLIGQPIRSLQTMLREISFVYTDLPRLIPDGVFEEETRRAVVSFQQLFNLPATGTVDNDTWDAVVVVYRQTLKVTSRPGPCAVYPANTYTVEPGDSTIHMYVIQSMFKSLSHVLDGIRVPVVDGRHTGVSVENALWLQRRGGLEETGIFDMRTWDLLARLYCTYITRNPTVH